MTNLFSNVKKYNLVQFLKRINIIRITYKQWSHILENHDYMAGQFNIVLETINSPDEIIQATTGEALALKKYQKTGISSKTCVSIYKEEQNGFLITAFLTSKPETLYKKAEIIWRK